MHNKYIFAPQISKGLASRGKEKVGCQEEEKGTGQIHSKETEMSWGLCQHKITPESQQWHPDTQDNVYL